MFGTSYVGFGSHPTYTQKIMTIPDIAWPTFFDSYRESMLKTIGSNVLAAWGVHSALHIFRLFIPPLAPLEIFPGNKFNVHFKESKANLYLAVTGCKKSQPLISRSESNPGCCTLCYSGYILLGFILTNKLICPRLEYPSCGSI